MVSHSDLAASTVAAVLATGCFFDPPEELINTTAGSGSGGSGATEVSTTTSGGTDATSTSGGTIPTTSVGTDTTTVGVSTSTSTQGNCPDEDGDGWVTECDSYPPDFPGPDCDDGDPNTFPGAAPNDDPDACIKDEDGDDWGDDDPGSPDVTPGTDCDDADSTTFPGAAEADDPNACMKDADDDGHGDAHPEEPGVVPGSDCHDGNPSLNPSALTLVTAPIVTGEISKVDTASGSVTPIGSVDVANFNPWIPTSLAVKPVDGSVYAALAFRDRLVTMNYCGAGTPTELPMAHNKSICGITFDRQGNLFGIDGQADQLLPINADGSITPGSIKSLTFDGATLDVADCGMAFDCHEDRLLISDSGSGGIYSVNLDDGIATRLADVAGEAHGAGLEYDPTTRTAISCDQTSIVSIELDGSDQFAKLTDLGSPADDLAFGPACN